MVRLAGDGGHQPISSSGMVVPPVDETALCFLPASAVASLMRDRQLSPVEVVDAVLRRIERLNPTLNAYCLVLADDARAQAKRAEAALARGDRQGPLHGVPVAVKDNLAMAGVPFTYGSRLLRDVVAAEDTPTVARLKQAGAIIVGRTNTPEFAWRGSTDNRLYGATCNPWDRSRTAGGSSGGSGAAVAAGLAYLALGTDGAGSIRIPSSFCGIVGLKPSFGRVPMYPTSGVSEQIGHAGPMTRTVRDAAILLDVVAGPDERDRYSLPPSRERYADAPGQGIRGLRVAWSRGLEHIPVEPEMARLAESAAQTFVELGCVVDEPRLDLPDPAPILAVTYPATQAGAHGGRPPTELAEMDPGLVAIVEEGKRYSIVDLGRALNARTAYWDAMRRVFECYDLLLTPTTSVPPFALGLVNPPDVAGAPVAHLAWTLAYPFNFTGQPAVTVPCGFTATGLPAGLQIVGPRFADGTVLRAAAAYEALRPWQDRRPPA